MEAARVRIGRVKMKAGGADVRVIRNDAPGNICTERLRDFTRKRLADSKPCEAMVCVTFRRHPDGGLVSSSTWGSVAYDLPQLLLPDLAAATLKADIADISAEDHVLSVLGYRVYDDDPAA